MNKKEIAQEFTRQTIGQGQKPDMQDPAIIMIKEIEKLLGRMQQETSNYASLLKILTYSIQDLQTKVQGLNQQADQLTEKISGASQRFRRHQKVSVWNRYWMAILMGIISTLITNLIWILKV